LQNWTLNQCFLLGRGSTTKPRLQPEEVVLK
jgi:hypothetical protein